MHNAAELEALPKATPWLRLHTQGRGEGSALSIFRLVQTVIVLASATVMLLGWEPEGDVIGWTQALVVLQAIHLVWTFASWRRCTGSTFDAYQVFVISNFVLCSSLSIFHLGDAGFSGADDVFLGRATPEDIYHAVLLITSCNVCLHWGALWSISRRMGPVRFEVQLEHRALFVSIGAVLSLVAFPCAVLTAVKMYSSASAGGYVAAYSAVEEGGIVSYLVAAGTSFSICASLVMACRQFRPNLAYVLWFTLGVTCLVYLLAGYRTPLVMILPGVLYVRHYYIKPFSSREWIVLLATAVVLGGLVVTYRSTLGSESKVISTLEDESGSSSGGWVSQQVNDLGAPFRTIVWTTALVPGSRGYEYGGTFLDSVSSAVPLISRMRIFETGESSADWLIGEVAPERALVGEGFGFSCYAEMYLNFGRYSVVAFLVLGLLIGWLIRWVRESPRHAAMRGLIESQIIGCLIFWSRGELAHVSRFAAFNIGLFALMFWTFRTSGAAYSRVVKVGRLSTLCDS